MSTIIDRITLAAVGIRKGFRHARTTEEVQIGRRYGGLSVTGVPPLVLEMEGIFSAATVAAAKENRRQLEEIYYNPEGYPWSYIQFDLSGAEYDGF